MEILILLLLLLLAALAALVYMLRTLDDKAWDELERMHRSGDVYTVASAAECVRGHPLFGTTYGTEGLLVLVNAPEHTGLLLMFAHAWAGAAQYKLRTLGPFPLGRGVVAALVPIDQLVPRDDLRYSPNPLRELRGRRINIVVVEVNRHTGRVIFSERLAHGSVETE